MHSGPRGYRVILLERNHWLGGKAAVLEQQGYRFDMGPTILTMPSVLGRLYSEAGLQLDDHLDLIQLDPQWRCFFDDGSVLDLRQNVDLMAAGLAEFSPRTASAEGYRRFLALSHQQSTISEQFFFWRPIGSVWDMVDARSKSRPSMLPALSALRPGRSVAATVRSFVSDARVAQMLDHFTQYVGSAPDQSPAVLCGIAHMQTSEGVWYPRGGIAAVSRALGALAPARRRSALRFRSTAHPD